MVHWKLPIFPQLAWPWHVAPSQLQCSGESRPPVVPDQDSSGLWGPGGDLLVFTPGEGGAVAGVSKASSTLQLANTAKGQYFTWAGMQIPGDCQCAG